MAWSLEHRDDTFLCRSYRGDEARSVKKLSESDKSVFKDDVAFKYADDEDVLKRLCGLK